MAPKKDKKDKKGKDAAPAQNEVTVTEVEKALWELEVADLNRKLARLRTTVDEYEVRNEELQKAYDKLDEDRADIIAYLKKTLNVKTEENIEMKDKIKGLEELREIETAEFKATVNELEINFTTMKDQLTSENKLLTGKLNTLEEFRAIRMDLMQKYEEQEQAFKDQKMKYKRIIYDTEKKFIIGKDKLKKEMERRLLNLAQDFQDASELRIAASTHRVLRENVALNNQLDSLLMGQARIADLNEKYKESERDARVAMEAAQEERDTAINKSIVQLKVIDNLTTAFQNMEKQKALYEKKVFDFETLEAKLKKLTNENSNLLLQVRILEQNLHAHIYDQNKSIAEYEKVVQERDKFKRVLKDSAFFVQSAIKMDEWCISDPAKEVRDRKDLLRNILRIILQYRDIDRSESMETIHSFSQVYEKGDLGFVPKLPPSKSQRSGTSTALAATSRETFTKDTESGPSVTSVSSALGSIKTIPSIQLVPAPSEVIVPQDSLPSFTVTSIKSIESEPEEVEPVEEAMTDMEKQLAASKLEIQKSILKDLAYSQILQASRDKLSEESEKKSKLELDATAYKSTDSGEKSGEEITDEPKDKEKEEQGEDKEKSEKVEGEENKGEEKPVEETEE